MLIEPMIKQLHALNLRGMATALTQLHATPQHHALTFEERLSLLIEREQTDRHSKRLAQRLRWAKLPQAATFEDLDTRTPRGIDPRLMAQLGALKFIDERLNVLMSGPTGVGKTYIASAICFAACRADYSVRCYRLPRLIEDLTRHHATATRAAFLRQLAKAQLLYIDDFGLTPLTDPIKRDLLEILEDRYDKSSTIITSQLPFDQWHAHLGDPTLADAILDRLVHNAYRLSLKGGSMRKNKRATADASEPLTRGADLSADTTTD